MDIIFNAEYKTSGGYSFVTADSDRIVVSIKQDDGSFPGVAFQVKEGKIVVDQVFRGDL